MRRPGAKRLAEYREPKRHHRPDLDRVASG